MATAERVADLQAQLQALSDQLTAEANAREDLQAQLDGLGSEASQVCLKGRQVPDQASCSARLFEHALHAPDSAIRKMLDLSLPCCCSLLPRPRKNCGIRWSIWRRS